MVTQTNIRKAAVLLMSLPEPDAATLIAKLSSQQVEAVSTEIAKLNSVSGDEQESVIREFAEVNPNQLDARSGGIDLAKALLERSLGSKASSTLDNIRQSIEALPFSFLQKVDSQNLLTFVVDEHPQTIALILSHIPPSQASEILAGIPPERQISVIRRIATMGQTSPEMIHEVEDGLERRMASVMSQSFENAGGVESVARARAKIWTYFHFPWI